MNEKVGELIDKTREKFNLNNYYLKQYQFFKEKNPRKETVFILNMEWFPNGSQSEGHGLNPPGTISIDVDFHTNKLRNIGFVMGVNEIEAGLPESNDIETAIKWVEKETGLKYGRQFQLAETVETRLTFLATADDIPVFPAGLITLEFNEEGKLSHYAIDGNFPPADRVHAETFALTKAGTKDILKTQFQLLEVPIVDEEKWKKIYVLASCFITNDGKQILPYEAVETIDPAFVPLHEVLQWNKPIEKSFQTQDIDLSTEVTEEEAIAGNKEQTKPLTEEDVEIAVKQTQDYLQSIQPEASGKWKITSIHREKAYLFAVLKPVKEETRIINRKLTIILDGQTFEPVNHVDNDLLLETFKHFEKAVPAEITIEEAFEKLYRAIELTPVYVYDKESEQYKLCGKVDSELAIDAETGELLNMESLN